mmetsp:Transcript_50453/g.153454  ORF Transcript_50453/g.153454 Transcript_50453/m.153454 type:complete len:236 (+) Transcript_50453:505-1212(+)
MCLSRNGSAAIQGSADCAPKRTPKGSSHCNVAAAAVLCFRCNSQYDPWLNSKTFTPGLARRTRCAAATIPSAATASTRQLEMAAASSETGRSPISTWSSAPGSSGLPGRGVPPQRPPALRSQYASRTSLQTKNLKASLVCTFPSPSCLRPSSTSSDPVPWKPATRTLTPLWFAGRGGCSHFQSAGQKRLQAPVNSESHVHETYRKALATKHKHLPASLATLPQPAMAAYARRAGL